MRDDPYYSRLWKPAAIGIAALFAVLVGTVVAFGQPMDSDPVEVPQASEVQLLKAYGHLPGISLDEVQELKASRAMLALAEEVVEDRWCGHPDFADAEIAEAEPEDLAEQLSLHPMIAEALVGMHAAMLEAKTGTGSWPAGCNPEQYPDRHAIWLHYDVRAWGPNYTRVATDQELLDIVRAGVWGVTDLEHARKLWGGKPVCDIAVDLAVESARRWGIYLMVTSTPQTTGIRLTNINIPGSTIGLGWFPNGTCRSLVEARIDRSWRASLHAIANLILHEIGHCLSMPHYFAGQATHRSVMGYQPAYPFQGFRFGPPETTIPRDPCIAQLTRQFGGEPVPPVAWWLRQDDPKPPPIPPPGNGSIRAQVGDALSLLLDGRRIELEITAITGDEGPTLSARVAAAADAIEDYPDKAQHRQALAMLYLASSQAVESGMTVEAAQEALKMLRPMLIGADGVKKWAPVIALADAVVTADGLTSVAEGLQGNAFLPPEVIMVIRIVATLLPDGNVKTIVTLILAILDARPAEQPPEQVDASLPVVPATRLPNAGQKVECDFIIQP
jgi:hypothetical protein